MQENINALDEVNKGATMGCDAISFIIDKVEDKKFKELLEKQYDLYDNIKKRLKKYIINIMMKKNHTKQML